MINISKKGNFYELRNTTGDERCEIQFIEHNTEHGLIELWHDVLLAVTEGKITVPPGSELKLMRGVEEIHRPKTCKCGIQKIALAETR